MTAVITSPQQGTTWRQPRRRQSFTCNLSANSSGMFSAVQFPP